MKKVIEYSKFCLIVKAYEDYIEKNTNPVDCLYRDINLHRFMLSDKRIRFIFCFGSRSMKRKLYLLAVSEHYKDCICHFTNPSKHIDYLCSFGSMSDEYKVWLNKKYAALVEHIWERTQEGEEIEMPVQQSYTKSTNIYPILAM